MKHVAMVVILFCIVCSSATAQICSDVRDYSYIFELSGSAIDKMLRGTNGTVITGVNGCDQVTIESARIDGYSRPAYPARITADLTVKTVVGNVVFTTPAMAVFDAQLAITGVPANAALSVVVAPDTLAVSGDLPFDRPAEWTVYSLKEQIARALSVAIPLGGLARIISASPSQQAVLIDAYQQGFVYIVQMYAPGVSTASYPPHVFRTGNVFTVSLTKPVVEALILKTLQENASLRLFSESGFPDEAGTISIERVGVELCEGTMLVNYYGTDRTGKGRTISWLMIFRRGEFGVDIQPIEVSVDGVSKPIPAENEYINPVSQAFFGLTRDTGQGMDIIMGTLGLTSLTYGEIRPWTVLMAGRQW